MNFVDRQPSTLPTGETAHARMMVFALRDGELVHVRDVANGKACGCICPECSDALIARNKGAKRAAHFSHASGADCASGYETALHLAGKEALLRLKRLALPEYRQTVSIVAGDGTVFSDEVSLSFPSATADQAWEEVWQEGFRPDVVFKVGQHQLFVEIKVSHAVDAEKLAKIRGKGIPAIELDLSRMPPEKLLSSDAFDDFLTSSLECRHWLFCRKGEMREVNVRAALQKRVADHLDDLRRKRMAQQEAYERQKRQAAELAARRDRQNHEKRQMIHAERQRLQPYLDKLANSQDAAWVAERERQFGQAVSVPSLESYGQLGIHDLFKRVQGHWAFNATFEQWQAYTLDLIFPADHTQQAEVSENEIVKKVEARFGVPEFIVELRRDQSMHFRKSLPGVLTDVERAAIPSADVTVTSYLDHLRRLGLVRRTDRFFERRELTACYRPLGRSVPEALERPPKASVSDQP